MSTVFLPHFTLTEQGITFLHQYLYLPGSRFDTQAAQIELLEAGVLVPSRQNSLQDGPADIIIIEPHPDDVALSVSGFVLEQLTAGRRVHVITCFNLSALSTFPVVQQFFCKLAEGGSIELKSKGQISVSC